MLENVGERKKYENEINRVSNEMSNLKQQYEATSESFLSGDVESAKARLYTNDWFNDSANVYKYKNVKQEYLTNPALADQRKVEQMNRADARMKVQLDQALKLKMLDIQMESDKERLKQNEITLEQFKEIQKKRERITVTESGAGDDEPLNPKELISKVNEDRDDLKTKVEQIKSNIVKMFGSEIDGDNLNDDEKFTSVLKMYRDKSTKLKHGVKRQIGQYLTAERLLNLNNDMINSAAAYADGAVDKTDYQLRVLDNLGYEGNETITIHPDGYSFKTGNVYEPVGQGYDYTSEEITNKFIEFENSNVPIDKYRVDDLDNLDAISKYTKKPIFTPNEKKGILKLTNNLDPRMVALYKAYRSGIGPDRGPTAEIYDIIRPIKKQVSKVADIKQEEDKKYNEAFTDKLKETYIVTKPINITIPTDKTGEVKALRDKLLVLVNERRIDNVVIDIGDDVVDASPAMNATSAYLRRAMDGSYKLMYAGEDGDFAAIDITMDEAINNFPDQVSVPNQYDDFDDIFTPTMLINRNPVEKKIIRKEDEDGNELPSEVVKTQSPLTYYTTSTDGKYNTKPGNEFLNQKDFPNVSNFEVTGNIVSDTNPIDVGGQPVFSLQLNIKNPNTGEYILKNVEMLPLSTKSTIINTMSQLSDNAIVAYIESEKTQEEKRKETMQQMQEYMNNIGKL